jgi:hypothetical protein
MSLLFVDGFDHYARADIATKWNNASLNVNDAIDATGGRDGGGALKISGQSAAGVSKVFPQTNTVILGARVRFDTLSAFPSSRQMIQLQMNGSIQGSVYLNVDGTLSVYRGTSSGTLLGSTVQALSGATFTYLELKYTTDNSAGSVEIRINGATDLLVSGINTQALSSPGINGITIRATPNSSLDSSKFIWYDDLYICDTHGATNNDFLGDIKIEAIYPTADGANKGLAPLSGTDHYAMVNQHPPDGDTSYNSSAITGAKDTYAFGDIPVKGDSILGVQVLANCRKENAGSRGVKLIARPGGTDNTSPVLPVSVDYGYQRYLWETNPDSGVAWTESEVNAAEFGLELSV